MDSEADWQNRWEKTQVESQREALAQDFIRQHVQVEGKLSQDVERKVNDLTSSIDFSKDVEVVTLPAGTVVKQYEGPEKVHPKEGEAAGGDVKEVPPGQGEHPHGAWFCPQTQDSWGTGIRGEFVGAASQKGGDPPGRSGDYFVLTRDTQVLQGTPKSVQSWQGSGELYYGGGTFYFAGERQEDKERFSRVVNPSRRL